MQKITLKEKVYEFQDKLLTNELINSIYKLWNDFDSNNHPIPQQWETAKNRLIQMIIKSKSNYDNLISKDVDLKIIADSIDNTVYSDASLSQLISKVSTTQFGNKKSMFSTKEILDFYLFHKGLNTTNDITQSTIKETQENENVIIFTLVTSENPNVNQVVEALTILQELIDIFEKLLEEEQENKLYLLDKGSNTNIGIETGVKTVKSVFEIFKEVWDWMVNRKFYKEKLRNAQFLDNLSIVSRIHELKESGALNDEDASRYKELIIKKTDKLLSINTMPRQLLLESDTKEDRLLLDYNEIRLLKEGKKESDS